MMHTCFDFDKLIDSFRIADVFGTPYIDARLFPTEKSLKMIGKDQYERELLTKYGILIIFNVSEIVNFLVTSEVHMCKCRLAEDEIVQTLFSIGYNDDLDCRWCLIGADGTNITAEQQKRLIAKLRDLANQAINDYSEK